MSLTLSAWTRPDRGALFVVTGASGTGKTTLVKEALKVVPGLGFSVSATTRAPRATEVDGVDYHFVTHAAFDALVAEGALLEWATVYGNRYGTLRAPVVAALEAGQSILLEIDQHGAAQVRAAMPEAVSIFVLPPAASAIGERLRARSTDAPEVIARRVAEAEAQLRCVGAFDYIVVNDDLPSAHDQFQAVLVATLLQRKRHETLVRRFSG